MRQTTLLHRLQSSAAGLQQSMNVLNFLIAAKEDQLDGLVVDCTAETLAGDKLSNLARGVDGKEMSAAEVMKRVREATASRSH